MFVAKTTFCDKPSFVAIKIFSDEKICAIQCNVVIEYVLLVTKLFIAKQQNLVAKDVGVNIFFLLLYFLVMVTIFNGNIASLTTKFLSLNVSSLKTNILELSQLNGGNTILIQMSNKKQKQLYNNYYKKCNKGLMAT